MVYKKKSKQPKSNCSGIAIIWMIVSIPFIVAICAVAVDFGRIQLAKSELQTAVSAAVRTAARGNMDDSAIARAISAAAENRVDGSPLVLQTSDILLGRWDASNRTFTNAYKSGGTWYMSDGSRINSVKITGVRSTARNTAIPNLFASVLGWSKMDITAEAIASGGPATVQPVTIHRFNETGSECADTAGNTTSQSAYILNMANVSRNGDIVIFNRPTKAATSGAATNITDNVVSTNQFTIHARIDPKTRSQTNATIMAVAGNATDRNFSIRQQGQKVEILLTTKDSQGNLVNTVLQSADFMTSNSQATYEVCATFDGSTLKLYTRVNDSYSSGTASGTGTMVSTSVSGNLGGWNRSYRLTYANEDSNDRPYLGALWHAEVYNTALNTSQIAKLFGDPNNIDFYPAASNASGAGGAVVSVK